MPSRQPKRGRLWLNDGSCIRLRPLHRNHVWSYDFVSTRTHDGRALKLLTVLDEYTRECVAIKVARKIRAHDVLEVLAELFARHGPPAHLRSGQRAGVHGQARAAVVGQARCSDAIHRARKSVGERLQRELQRQAEGRVPERRNLLHTARGCRPRRAVEAALQYRPTPQRLGRTTPRPRDNQTIVLVPQNAPTSWTTDGSSSNIGSGTPPGGTSAGGEGIRTMCGATRRIAPGARRRASDSHRSLNDFRLLTGPSGASRARRKDRESRPSWRTSHRPKRLAIKGR